MSVVLMADVELKLNAVHKRNILILLKIQLQYLCQQSLVLLELYVLSVYVYDDIKKNVIISKKEIEIDF